MRTNIAIRDDLMQEALQLSDVKTKKAVVEEGLKLFVKFKKQQKITSLRGKLHWEGDLHTMRLDR
jgi:Arc/MetJ family transcription regulator